MSIMKLLIRTIYKWFHHFFICVPLSINRTNANNYDVFKFKSFWIVLQYKHVGLFYIRLYSMGFSPFYNKKNIYWLMAGGSVLFENLICYRGWLETQNHTFKLGLYRWIDDFVAKFLTLHICFVWDTFDFFRIVPFL